MFGLGFLFIAIALPFVTSGLMLRAYANSFSSVNGSSLRRVVTLTVTVVCIAVVSVAFTALMDVLLYDLLGSLFYSLVSFR